MTPELRDKLPALLPLLLALPNDQHFELEFNDNDNAIEFQCDTQIRVRRLRACFPGTVWQKSYSASCQWWEYATEYAGVKLRIYAVKEAPPSCRAIEEEVEVNEEVPVTFETRVVKKKIIRWDCGGGAKAATE
jgi:hypothetical protein